MAEIHYLIIGAGAAGCTLAARLSEDENTQVTVLEAGGSDKKLIIAMPAAVPFAYMNSKIAWGEQAGPEPHLDNRYIDEKRGHVLGGTTSIIGRQEKRRMSHSLSRDVL